MGAALAKHDALGMDMRLGYAMVIAATMAAPAVASIAPAETIYVGGDLLTMNDTAPRAQAMAVAGGRIVAVGSRAQVMRRRGPGTIIVDLNGHTLVPGFVDGHSHFSGVGFQANAANLLPPPDGPASSIADIQAILRDWIANSPVVKATGVAIGFDYDDSQLQEQRSPTRADLDAVSTAVPIVLTHQSGHLGVYNSKALELAGINADTPDPSGGVIRRQADGRTPDGVLEETAHFAAIYKVLPKFTAEQGMAMVAAAQKVYLANGFTTVQEGRADPSTLALLAGAATAGKLLVDVVAYPDIQTNKDNPALNGPLMSRNYTDHFRLGGVKLSLDGSPQGKTAWFTEPYFMVPTGRAANYAGYAALPAPGAAQALVETAYRNNWQLLVHGNGDAAIDQMLASVDAAQKAYPGSDRRTVLIHGQYLRADQIPRLKALGIMPSLYPMHTFYWGDWHRSSVAGPQRAAFTSPTAAVMQAGMKFSIHSDAPVTFPNSMRVLDSAVNRTTRSGFVLGPDQRISPLVALKAMTIWPAYQHFEEASKGSLEIGKVADFVILSANPLRIATKSLISIKVLATYKGGKPVYEMAQVAGSR
jgi:predicted amidohydrolase YtcJ